MVQPANWSRLVGGGVLRSAEQTPQGDQGVSVGGFGKDERRNAVFLFVVILEGLVGMLVHTGT